MNIDSGMKYTHVRGGVYLVIGLCNLKNEETREWVPGILYVSEFYPSIKGSRLYVRSQVDFERNFQEIRPPTESA